MTNQAKQLADSNGANFYFRNVNSAGSNIRSKKQKLSDDNTENPLDRTWIHPESYSVALR